MSQRKFPKKHNPHDTHTDNLSGTIYSSCDLACKYCSIKFVPENCGHMMWVKTGDPWISYPDEVSKLIDGWCPKMLNDTYALFFNMPKDKLEALYPFILEASNHINDVINSTAELHIKILKEGLHDFLKFILSRAGLEYEIPANYAKSVDLTTVASYVAPPKYKKDIRHIKIDDNALSKWPDRRRTGPILRRNWYTR